VSLVAPFGVVVAKAEQNGRKQPDGYRKVENAASLRLALDSGSRAAEIGKDGLGVPISVRCRDTEVRLNKARRLVGRRIWVLGRDFALQPGKVLPKDIPLTPQFFRSAGHDCPPDRLRPP
jgi:hypothetical protein